MVNDSHWGQFEWVVGLKKMVVKRSSSTSRSKGKTWSTIGEVVCTSSDGDPKTVPVLLDCGGFPLVLYLGVIRIHGAYQ